jgi:hypothetical protein
VEVEGELDDGHELGEDIGGVGAISALEYCGKYVFELVVINALEIGAIGILEDRVGYVGADFLVMASAVPSFVTMMA